MTPAPCKCGHPAARHHHGARCCMDCKCDGYEPEVRELSAEATRIGKAIAGLEWEALAAVLQDVLDQRDSWQRECERTVEQRDAERRRADTAELRAQKLYQTSESAIRLQDEANERADGYARALTHALQRAEHAESRLTDMQATSTLQLEALRALRAELHEALPRAVGTDAPALDSGHRQERAQ